MNLQPGYIVQDRASHKFLFPHEEGDVGYTYSIIEAGIFPNEQAAIETALDYCDDTGFDVFEFYRNVD